MNEPAHASTSSAFVRGHDVAGNLLLAAAYALTGIGGLHLTFFHPNVTSVWPPSGIALAALLIFGPKLLPGVAIGAFLVVLWLSGDLVASTGVALGNTLAAWVGYTLLRRVDFDSAMLRLRDPAALLFWGAILAPAIAATLGPASMWAGGLLPAAEYREAWTVWWIGDALGVLLFVPLILLTRELLRGTWRAPRAARAWVYVAVQAALAFAIFHGAASERFGLQDVNYFLLPFAVWLALRHEPPFTAIANAAVFAIAVWGTAAGSGPFAGAAAQGSLLLLHLFVAVFCCTTLLIASTSAERHRALRTARASSNELRSLAELSHDWYWEQDKNLRYSRVGGLRNAEPGTNIADQIGKTRWEVPYTGVSAEQREALDRLIAEQKPFYDFPITRFSENGEPRLISTSGVPIIDQRGRFRGYRGIGRDITNEKLAQAAIRDSEARFRSLTELSSDWYWEQDADFRYTFVSQPIERIGVSVNEHYGLRRWDLPGVRMDAQALARHKAALEAREPFHQFIYQRVYADGSVRYMSVSGLPIFDDAGGFRGYRGIGKDVTGEKEAERALRESEARFRSLTELSSDWYWEQDENLRFTLVSGGDQGPAGIVGSESLRRTRFELPNIFESEEIRRAHGADLRARRPFRNLVLKRTLPDGSMRFSSISGEPVFDADGRFSGYCGTGKDITAEKTAEQRAARLRDLYAVLSEANDAIIHATDEEQLFSRICGIAVKPGRFSFAWIGAIDAHSHAIRPVAVAGDDRGYPYKVSLSADTRAFAGAAAATAWSEGEPYVSDDSVADLRNAPWNDLLRSCGVGSHVSFALKRGGKSVHSLHLYAAEKNFFDAELIALLRRLSLNISYALDNFDRERARQQADRALTEARHFFEGVLNAIASPIVVKDADHRFIAFNATAEMFLGRPREELIGKTDYDLFPPDRARYLQETDELALSAAEPIEYESQYNVGDKVYTMLVRKSALMRPDGSRVLVLVMTDVTARKTAEDALRDSEQRFRDVAEVAGEYVWENDLKGRFTFISAKVVEVLGYTAEELIGHSAAEFMPPGEAERVRRWFADNMAADRSFRGLEHRLVSKSGEVLWLQISGVYRHDRDGRSAGHRGTTRDITEIKRNEARISYLATRDPLTELPNRLLFNDRLEQGLINARRSKESVGVLFIDLDRFKNVNDSLGHHLGDLMLKEVAQRMNGCIRRGDTIARLGGDEFVIALEHLKRAEDAAHVAGKIIRSLGRPIEVAGNTLNTSCSIGISIFPNDADDVPTLMKNADTAMYYAKEKGRNNFQFFSPDMNVRAVERHHLEISLRRALDRGDFTLLYQPQVAIGSGTVIGAEALIRWRDPERGLIAPSGFIGVAEESGLIEPIGRWVLMEACAQVRRWQDQGLPHVRVAVNISPRQLIDPQEFLAHVNRVLDQTGIDPRYLELEMTESLLLHNVDENAAALRKLGKLGVRIAVDDFGTGYSSLAYLKQLPIDSLKIDRTFVRDIESDPDDAAIIKAVIAMAHGLKPRVTAEGVETQGQLDALRALDCDEYQGYLLSKPIAADEFAQRFLAGTAPKLVR